MVEAKEVGFGDHHGVATSTEVSRIFQFFGEYVTGVDDTGNVEDADVAVDDSFSNFAFSQVNINMLHAFIGEGATPSNSSLVVIVDDDALVCICHAKILGAKLDVKEFCGTFVGDHNFGLARTLSGLIL